MNPDATSSNPASPWTRHLERAHDLAHRAARSIEDRTEPSTTLASAARRLEHALASMYDAFDGRADRVTAINTAHAGLWDAAVLVARAGMSATLTTLREACAELVSSEERFPRVPLPGRAPAKLHASSDLPTLHVIERASLRPSFRAPPEPAPEPSVPVLDLPEPTTFDELATVAKAARRFAEERRVASARRREPAAAAKPLPPSPARVPPGFAFTPPVALEERRFIERWARQCFEEIGMLGTQRAPLPGDDWRACLALERRLVTAIDALAALGPPAIAYVEPLALDMPAVNPMSIFAITIIGGSLEGRDALACAERVLHRFGSDDPLVAAPFVSAMKLAPNPFVKGAMMSLYASAEVACRRIAVEVLAHRGWLEEAQLADLAFEEEPTLLALALPALAAVRHRSLPEALARALDHGDLRVQAAALDAMAVSAHPEAASAARSAAQRALGDRALVRLALVANEDDARWLLDRVEASPTPAGVEALGWAGLVDATKVLLRLLDSDDEALKRAAGTALDRLLGANLIERIEIMPEKLEEIDLVDPDPAPPTSHLPLAALVGHPRDQPSAGSPDTLDVPSMNPAKWRAHLAEHGRRYNPKQRLRRGQPYSPSVSLYELDRLPLGTEDRRRLHRELAARTGKLSPFDPHDFVRTQEQSLTAWEALLRSSTETPGSWSRPSRR